MFVFPLPPDNDFVEASPAAPYNPEELGKSPPALHPPTLCLSSLILHENHALLGGRPDEILGDGKAEGEKARGHFLSACSFRASIGFFGG